MLDSVIDDILHRICINLQISQTQHDLAEARYKAIGELLEAEDSPLSDYEPIIYPQGSLNIGTTVKPWRQREFDLDLVCELKGIEWKEFPNPVELLDGLEDRLRFNARYDKMVERKNRCVRVNYANDFHLDILPACPDEASGDSCVLVPDREAQDWKHSNPKGYARWFETEASKVVITESKFVEPLPDREPVERKPPLKRTVQVLKRLRDVEYANNQQIAPISIVLTTLAAQHYAGQQSVNAALMSILNGIVASIPSDGSRLKVLNPTNPKEDLSERWEDQRSYNAFVAGIRKLRSRWQELNGVLRQAQGYHRVAPLLESLLGESVTKTAIAEQANYMESLRSAQRLSVRRKTGIITASSGAESVHIPPNTFYGTDRSTRARPCPIRSGCLRPKDLTIAQQRLAMSSRFPQFRFEGEPGVAIWTGSVSPSAISQNYHVKIEYRLDTAPTISVISPRIERLPGGAHNPHLYAPDQPCLYWPQAGDWHPGKSIAVTIIPWISLWLYFYEVWLATEEWLGGGQHPAMDGSGRKRRRRS